jgi:predicted cation transporter
MVERYLLYIPAWGLYWINTISAVLDNATLTAAEITPLMNRETIRYLLLGLLISGGMLIPGNIPNIICAGKLSIRSKEWVKAGVPLGLVLMVGYFIVLIFPTHLRYNIQQLYFGTIVRFRDFQFNNKGKYVFCALLASL